MILLIYLTFVIRVVWINMSNGGVSSNAAVGDNTLFNEPPYIERARVSGDMCVGKICQSNGCACMSYRGAEYRVHSYKALRYHN